MLRLSLVRRGLVAGALLAAGGGALALGVPSVAGATVTATKITGGGASAVTLGHPQSLANAKVTPTAVTYTATTGNIAFISSNQVFLVPGKKEANQFDIQTGSTPATFSTLTPADVYLVAGTKTDKRHIVGNPGTGTTVSTSSTSYVATGNPIAPTSVLFAKNGNLLIGEKNIVTGTQEAVAIQFVAKSASSTGYGVTSVVAGGLYSIAGGGLLTQPKREIALGGLFNYDMTLDSTTPQGNIISSTNGAVQYLNFGAASITGMYGVTLVHGAATTITGTLTATGTCTSGGGSLTARGTAGPAILGTPPVTVDATNDVYVSDNTSTANHGCTWVLPATTGHLDGITVTAGNIYNLTAASTAAAATAGATANTHYLADVQGLAIDAAGNVVLGADGGSDNGLWILAEHAGSYWGQTVAAGDLYKVGVTLTGVTSLANGAVGTFYLADPGFAYKVSGGPTTGSTPTTHTTLSEQPASGTASAGTTVAITCTVTPAGTGTAKFYVTGTLKATDPLTGGVATYKTTALPVGTSELKCTYVTNAPATFTSSSSGTVAYKVTTSTTKVTGVFQQLGETVKGGHLTLSCTKYETAKATITIKATQIRVCNLITLPSATITGAAQVKTAGMNDLYINTARGTPTSGWSLSAVMVPSTLIPTTTHNGRHNDNTNVSCDGVQGFCDSSIGTHATSPHGQIPAADLSLIGYACTPAVTNHSPAPTATPGGTLATAKVLCTAAAGTSAGEFLVNGGTYALTIPGTLYKGLYYGTVEFTLTATA